MVDLSHLGMVGEAEAIWRAFWHWRPIRNGSVFRPRCASQASKGPSTPDELAYLLYGRVRRTGDDRPGREVPVAREVLGRTVDDYVRAELQGPLEIWCAERVVHDQGSPRGAG